VHTFGIDTAVNDHLLERLAAQNRGFCHLVTPDDDIAGAISALGAKLRQPVLRSLAAPEGWEFAGGPPPDLFAGDALTVPLKGPGMLVNDTAVALGARRPDGTRHELPVKLESATGDIPWLVWTRARLDHLVAGGKQAEAIALAKSANLLCDGTAFVAWDESEKIAVAGPRIDIYQPAMSPADWGAMPRMAAAAPDMLSDHAVLYEMRAMPMSALPRTAFFRESGGGGPVRRFLKHLKESAPLEAAPNTPAPPVSGGPPSWRVRLERIDALGATDAGRRLLDWLEQWWLANPSERTTRERELEKLARKVSKAHSSADALERLEAGLRSLLDGHPAFLRPCLELVAELKSGKSVR
jgi:hypothetical protein